MYVSAWKNSLLLIRSTALRQTMSINDGKQGRQTGSGIVATGRRLLLLGLRALCHPSRLILAILPS